ncbi:MAG: penicillin-binding protein 1C [Cyclobacteriaceae bacterium]
MWKIKQKYSKRLIRLSISLLILSAIAAYYYALPDPLFRPVYSTVLEDRQGTLLGASIADDGQWRFPLSDSVPDKFRQAIISFEDDYFYQHPGFNPLSLFRASWQNLKAKRIVSGGSTLSMQVIRLSRQGKARTIMEKILEIILATRLELKYSKEEIMTLYAAHAPFGGNVVGLDAAAWRYYGRQPEQLSWGEVATLAVLPNSPSLVYPGKNEEKLRKKRNRLLDKLRQKALIDSLGCELAKLEPLPGHPLPLPDEARHLLSRSMQEGKKGQRIRSSLKAGLQQDVKQIVQQHYERLSANGVHNAAALVLEAESGKVLAYVGNTAPRNPHLHAASVDIITAKRSTGSILKPLLYAAMLHEGSILPYALVPDIPTYIDGFAPKNFDEKYDGVVAADEALARSLNVPAVHMLREYGVEKFHFLLRRMGMYSLDKPAGHYGLSLILGGAEASLWEIGSIYASLARSMRHYFKYPEPKRYNAADYHLPDYLLPEEKQQQKLQKEGLLGAGALWYTFEAMAKVRRPENSSGWEYFDSSRKLAWKTGTSFGFRDAWAIGLTPDYVIAVWAGNADGEGRAGHTGLTAASPLLFDIVQLMPEGKWFDYPGSDMTRLSVSRKTGYRADRYCNDAVAMEVPSAGIRSPLCNYHQQVNLDETGKFRVHSECEPISRMQTQNWFVLPPVQEWYYQQLHPAYQPLPTFRADCTPTHLQPLLQLIYPYEGAKIYVPKELDGEKGRTIFEAAHSNPRSRIFWHLDDTYLGETQQTHQMGIMPAPGSHRITLVDDQGNTLAHNFTVLSTD